MTEYHHRPVTPRPRTLEQKRQLPIARPPFDEPLVPGLRRRLGTTAIGFTAGYTHSDEDDFLRDSARK